ncbi:MAG: ribose-5-phosphate isomerase A [Phycisphaeraceae bacterium]|nr:MAG: ribose-5-phosphate isomerase A [Phycisphaeraceae bacterium]
MSEQGVGDALAEAALESVRNGMVIGLGAGRTAARGIRALADRVRLTGLKVECVCASEAAEALAREVGLTIADFALLEKLDLLIDGADEVDRKMRVLKGSRGAVTRERMLCWASERTVFMVGERKVAEQIGSQATLAIAIMPFGMTPTRNAIRELGLNGVVRVGYNGDYFITDNGNLILDVSLDGNEDLEDLATTLNDIPGIVDHGLFLNEADLILIEHEDGTVEPLHRTPPARG